MHIRNDLTSIFTVSFSPVFKTPSIIITPSHENHLADCRFWSYSSLLKRTICHWAKCLNIKDTFKFLNIQQFLKQGSPKDTEKGFYQAKTFIQQRWRTLDSRKLSHFQQTGCGVFLFFVSVSRCRPSLYKHVWAKRSNINIPATG